MCLPFSTVPNVKNAHEAAKIPKKAYDWGFYDYPMSRDPLGIRYPGYWFRRKFVYVKEMEPELMVPDLTGFQLKPYVSYRVQDVTSEPLTAENLFRQTYGNLIIDAYVSGERLEITTSKEEIEEARLRHQQTGADLFSTSVEEAEALAKD